MSIDVRDIPTDSSGRPDPAFLTESAEHYADLHALAMRATRDDDARLAFSQRVIATWGLIARGADAVPIALTMLQSTQPDAREDGAAILADIGRTANTVGQVLAVLAAETDPQAKDSLIQALGALRNRAAIPALTAIIDDETTDGDTRWCAIESLGKIVRRRFLDQVDPLASAKDWISRYHARQRPRSGK